MSYLISISIGPVQDFISTARRSRDLWFGSYLLSELSKAVARTIGKENLIFPSIENDTDLKENSEFNVVNKILAVVEDPQNVSQACETEYRKILNTLANKIFDEIESSLSQKDKQAFYRQNAQAQIDDLVEFYWAAYPFDPNKYKECRDRVENLLNARKSTRNFETVGWGSNAPKSSLDGQRESVIEDEKINELYIQKIFGLRKKERLCGVGLLKRLGEKRTNDSFFSTSHLATLPLLSKLKNTEENHQAVNHYVEKISDLLFEIENEKLYKYIGRVPKNLKHEVFREYDGHLLFENRLEDLPFESKEKLREAKEALKVFLNTTLDGKSPLPYYALLLADGDRMGTVIDNQKNQTDHKELSKALSTFAQHVKSIVEKPQNNGSLVYAGGDDVLAFVPLHTVLDCAKELSEKFKNDLKDFKDGEGSAPTLSVGIAVAHHIEPLQDALATLRRSEKEAKTFPGKNALAIIVSKRSGSDTTVKGAWDNDRKTDKSFLERLKWLVQLHLDDALPDGAAYELRDLWLRLKGLTDEKPMRKEAMRILQRKRSNQGLKEVSKEILEKLQDFIMSKEFSLEDLANEIIVAKDFSKAYEQANRQAIGEEENDVTNMDN